MEIRREELLMLFEMISKKTGESLDFTGFGAIEAKIGLQLNQKYLYTKHSEIIKNTSEAISIQEIKLKGLLDYLGFENYQSFKSHFINPISDILKSCEGVWISFVRQNSSEGILYKSPVKIFEQSRKMYFELRGPVTTYMGELTYSNGCLNTLFHGSSGRLFNHIYKIGNRRSPKILQGIYSGISTGDDPIGGRTVLCKVDFPFEAIENQVLYVSELKNSEDVLNQNLGQYFDFYEKNNLKLNPIVSFDKEDLRV